MMKGDLKILNISIKILCSLVGLISVRNETGEIKEKIIQTILNNSMNPDSRKAIDEAFRLYLTTG